MTPRPKPPSLRALTRDLRGLHGAWAHDVAGGEYVCLACLKCDTSGLQIWDVVIDDGSRYSGYGREWIPGDGQPFDAVAAARRLLAAWKDAQP